MASIFTHPAFPVGLALLKKGRVSRRLLYLSIVLSILPDADVIAFRFGIPYASQWGHRGFTHSIVFSIVLGLFFIPFSRTLQASKLETFLWTFGSTLSHSLFDALTNGGLGVALFWPFSHERYFFPVRPIAVSPIGAAGFFSVRGVVVLISEFFWIWLPLLILSAGLRFYRTKFIEEK